MKKLILPLLFLFSFPTAVEASPWSQMLKGGLKGGLKSGSGGGKSYEKILFKKQIGNNSWNNIKVTKSYDSFDEKTTCKFKLFESKLNIDIMYLSVHNYELKLQGNYYISGRPTDQYAFKFDNNPPERIASGNMYKYSPDKKVIPFSKWSQYKHLTIKNGRDVDTVKLKDLVKAIDKYKECKRS